MTGEGFSRKNLARKWKFLERMQGYTRDAILGTWYPSGFHGHFRSKSRHEFTIPYRQKAKPLPPTKFLDRASVRSNDHLFSRHDNRNAHASTMGDLETYFSHGLGKGKPKSKSVQHYKDTSRLLTWSTETPSRPSTSYRAEFVSPPSWQSQRLINESEPIHVRSNLGLRRRQINPQNCSPMTRTAPLLAWNDSDYYSHAKPCVGTIRDRSTNTRALSRPDSAANSRSLQMTSSDGNRDNVMETVTRLDL